MKIYFWGGLGIILVSFLIMLGNYGQYQVERDGVIVRMQISKMPNSCIGTKVKHLARFRYGNTVYVKQVGVSFCDDYRLGEFVEMKYLDGKSFIMFPTESVLPTFYLIFGSFLFGVGCVVYYYIKR